MAVHQHRGDVVGALALEGLHNDLAGFQLVLPGDFLGGHLAGAGDFPVEVVPVGGAQSRHAPAHLAEDGGPPAVGVHHAADVLKAAVQLAVGVGVGGGVPLALHLFAGADVHQHHVLGGELVVLHAAGLDGHNAALPVDAADVAPGEGHQMVGGQQHIGLIHLLFQLF